MQLATSNKKRRLPAQVHIPLSEPTAQALWELDIAELEGRIVEASGRADVNDMLQSGWILLHIYTLKYREDGIWRERPMVILGRPR